MIPSYKNKKVLVMGLGLHGGGVDVAKFFYKQGAQVLVTDLKPAEKLTESLTKLKTFKKIKYILGRHEEADFLWADLIVKNPDVPSTSPYLEIARKNNIPIETDITLFFKLSKAFIIGVTGTKGKSTTSSLIYHVIKSKFKRTFLAGNIGLSPLALLPKIKKGDMVVLELSSFGLEDLTQSPQIAVITNIHPDHLNRYASMQEYVEAKKLIFKFQGKKDALVLNSEDSIVRQMAKDAIVKIHFFSDPEKTNIPASIEVAKILKIPQKTIDKALKTFKGIHSRQELVKEVNGVKYINDTTATIPEAVVLAINNFSSKYPKSNIFVICGGVYKGVNYSEFAKKVIEENVRLIIIPGSASEKMKEALPGYLNIFDASSMQEAVQIGHKLAKAGDVVILSPAASSFNMFKNEFDRGGQFIKYVNELRNNEATL